MLKYSLLGVLLVSITVIIHAIGTTRWLLRLSRRFAGVVDLHRPSRSLRILTSTIVVLMALHIVEIVVWALAYLYLLPANVLGSFEEATYFSFVTFTTLGYGDITFTDEWRILSGIESLNGILLLGWSTAMLFAVVQRTWKDMLKDIADHID